MTRRWVGAVAVVAVLTAGCGGDDDTTNDAVQDEETTTTTAAEATTGTSAEVDGVLEIDVAARQQARIEILGGPDWLAADDDFLYVKRDNGGVDRIDPETNEVVASVDIEGDLCQGVGAGPEGVWSCSGTDIVRLDFDDESVAATIPVGKASVQGTLPVAAGRVWALVGDGSQLVGVDVETDEPGAPIELGIRGSDLAAEDVGAWVVSGPDDAAVHVDLTTGTVTRRVDGLDTPTSVAIDEGVWIGGGRSTVRIEPADGTITTRAEIGPTADGAIAVEGPDLWVRTPGSFLERVDTADGTVVERLKADDLTSGGDVLVAFGSVWATAYDDATLFRITADDA